MVKHTQTNRLLPTNCLIVFHHFVGLALKGLRFLSFDTTIRYTVPSKLDCFSSYKLIYLENTKIRNGENEFLLYITSPHKTLWTPSDQYMMLFIIIKYFMNCSNVQIYQVSVEFFKNLISFKDFEMRYDLQFNRD